MSSPIITTVELSNSSLNVTLSIGDINSNTVIEFNNSNLSVNISFGGGTYRHNELTDESKSLPNQHPASSITYGDGNVEEVLNGRFLSVDEGTNVEIDNTDPQRPIISVKETPQFIDVDIHALKSDANGGVIPATIWAWLWATAGSVLSVLSNLITKVFNLYPQTGLTFSGAIDLTKVDTHYSNYAQTGVLDITIAANSIIGGSAEITITANGSAITVTGATQYGDTAIDYTNGKINHFLFTKFSNGIYYSVKQLN